MVEINSLSNCKQKKLLNFLFLVVQTAADFVSWSPDGELYIVVINSVINVYTITTATITCTIDFKHRVLAVSFLTVGDILDC